MTKRQANYPIQPLILNRWSPRAMSAEPISDDELMPLFEAARWAPSSYNNQPWRFLYAKRETPFFKKFFNILVEPNQKWCKMASVLGIILSKTVFEKNQKPSITHHFDTGAAWENLALEGSSRNLVVHGLQGFNYDQAKKDFEIPDLFEVIAMFAIGKPAPKETLPKELQLKEIPSNRKPLLEIAIEGVFRQ